MPGNESPENIHNFFEQENSSQGHQSQGGGRNWPILNNNPCVGTRMQNGLPPTFCSKNFVSQSLDSERGNVMQSIQAPLGANPMQSSLNPELIRCQPRNQQLNINGYMDGSQGLQLRPVQAQFQGDGSVSDNNHGSMHRGFSSFEPHHNAPVYNSGLAWSSERSEITETPVSFDFLGSQQLMRTQHPGLAQPRPREQQGINEMHLWQQQSMYKRLQEMQQQQQLQQLQQSGRHHNSLSQLSGIARQETSDQLPAILSGMPINDASNFMRSNELLGGELKLPSSSPMLLSGNLSWAQHSGSPIQGIPNGVMLSHDKGQAIRSMGFVPQQSDQSLYGTPVASTRGSMTHPLQFQGTSHNFTSTDMPTKAGVNLSEKALMQASAFNYAQRDQYTVPGQGYLQDGILLVRQGIQGNNMSENGPTRSESGGATSGSFQQVNQFSPGVQVQEVEQVGPSQALPCLDPTEEKLLFSGNDDGNQDAPFGGSNHSAGGYLQNPSQSDDYLGAFPSIHSGSWSALMQEAVEASSSDIGLNEEWSGLSLLKTELSSRNHSTVLNANNVKQQGPWGDGNRQNASSLTSTACPLFKDTEGSPGCHATPSFQPNYRQSEAAPADNFHEYFQLSSKEAKSKLSDQQNQSAEGSLSQQSQFNSTSSGVWAGHMHEQPAGDAHSAEFNPQNIQCSWVQQHKLPSQIVNNRPLSKKNGWNIEASAPVGGNASKTNYNDDRKHHFMNMEGEPEGSMWKFGGSRVTTKSNSPGEQEAVNSDIGSPLMPNEGSLPNEGSTSQSPQNKRGGLTSENMLELLHKVDQSRVGNTDACFDFSERNASSDMPDVDVSVGSAYHLQHNELSSLQGVALKLAPPSERQSASDRPLPSQTSLTTHGVDQMNSDSEVSEKVQTWSLSSISVHSLPPAHNISQKGKGDDKYSISGHRSNEAMNSSSQGNLSAATNYTLQINQSRVHQQQHEQQQWQQQQHQQQLQQQRKQQQRQWQQRQQQQQQQHVSSQIDSMLDSQSTSVPFVNKVDVVPKQPFHTGKGHRPQVGALDQSAEASLPSDIGRIPLARFTPVNTCGSAASQFYAVSTGHSEPIVSSSLRSSGQQNPAVETRSVAQPSATSARSQKGGFSKMLHNVWTTVSSQRKASGLQPQKIISNVLQSMSPLLCSRETSSHTSQKADNHSKRKGEISPSEHGDHLVKDTSSQHMPKPEMVNIENKAEYVPRGEEPDPKRHSDGPSVASLRSSVDLHHRQDLRGGKHTQDSSLDTHEGYVPRASVSSTNRNPGPYGHSSESSEVQKHNYSLLVQMQVMKGADSDPSKRSGKRLKGTDSGSETSQEDWAEGHRHVYGQNTAFREMNAASSKMSFPSDARVLSFSSRENEGNNTKTSLQDPSEEAPTQDQVINKQHLHNHAHPHGRTSPLTCIGGGNRPQISPQMAPSWFEQYGNYKNGHILTTNNEVDSLQRSAKAAAQHHFFSKFSEGMNTAIAREQRYEVSQVLQSDSSSTAVAPNHSLASSPCPPLEVIGNHMVLIPKKRKSPTEDLLPWHKLVTEGYQKLQSLSTIESKWATATNKLTEKVEDEHGMLEDGFPTSRSRRRLILTSQLMQQIVPSVPARFLTAYVTTSYESVAFFCAKLILGDACGRASCSGGHSHIDVNSNNMGAGKLTISEKEKDNHFSKAAENFMGRSMKLEHDFLRLNSRASILDIRLECQELERTSIINHFAKFHGRPQIEGVESSSISETGLRRTFPQRHVTALALSTNLPEGVACLSL